MRRALLALALAALTACGEPSGTPGSATIALRPTFAAGTRLDALSLVIDNVRAVVYRLTSDEVVADQTAPFAVDAQQVQLTVRVPLEQASETVFVILELRAGPQVLFSGSQSVTVEAGGGSAPAPVPLGYIGPGANIASITIAPRDTTVTTGDSVQFAATAIDSLQAPVPDFYVGWSTSDSLRGTVNATGLFRAAAVAPARAGVYVIATTPTGVADSVLVTLAAPTPAQISGTVRNALTGAVIVNASVQVKAGGNATASDPTLQTVATNTGGDYLVTGLAAGSYTVFVQATNFLTARVAGITLAAGEVRTLDVALSPPQQTGQTRIILSWDTLPPDLDAYLVVPPPATGGAPAVVYFGSPGDSLLYPFVTLDQDVTSGYGPETITIHQQQAGVYSFVVHDYTTNSDSTSLALANSQARVEVYQNNQLVRSFAVPSGPGTLWTVFTLSGATITSVNTITNDPPPVGGVSAAAPVSAPSRGKIPSP